MTDQNAATDRLKPVPTGITSQPFESISELRDAHAQLIALVDSELQTDSSVDGERQAIERHLDEAVSFIYRSAATGVFLEHVGDRTAATVLLDYWVSALARAGHPLESQRLRPFDAAKLPDLSDKPCPFKGLDAFTLDDQKFFFGRDDDIKALAAQIVEHPLVIVAGASGSGKSSLVMSGALPAVKAHGGFRLLDVLRPGNAVLEHLARAAQVGAAAPEPGTRLHDEPERLVAWLGGDEAPATIITIDQFEEVFTLASDGDRRTLATSLARLLDGRKHRVVLTIREEFQTRFVELEPLRQHLDKAWYHMRPMGYDALRAAIDRPASLVNLQFQPGIADELVKSVLGQPAALPLLQFTLRALWDHRDRNRITREVYDKVGDPLTALKASADAFYDGVPQETKDEVRRVLLELVRVDDFLEAYRQPVPLSRLLGAGRANTAAVVALLIQKDYLRTSPGAGNDELVEVKHESLIRNWPRYVTWIDEKRLIRRRRLTITEAAARWEKDRNPELLFKGWQLEEARNYQDLSPSESAFLAASQDAADQSKRQNEERIRREGRVRLRWLTVATIAAASISVAFAILWRRANETGDKASLLAELTGARFLAESDPTAGIVGIGLAMESHQSVADDADMWAASLRAISGVPDTAVTQAKFEHPDLVDAFCLQKPGDAGIAGIVTRGRTDLRFWSARGVGLGHFASDPPADPIVFAGVTADGTGLVAVWKDVVRWFDERGQVVKTVKPGAAVNAAAASRTGGRLFLASAGGVTVLGADGAALGGFGEAYGLIDEVVPNGDGTVAATLQSGVLRIWDVPSGRPRFVPSNPPPRRGAPGPVDTWPPEVRSVLFVPTPIGEIVQAIGSDAVTRWWRSGDGSPARFGTRPPEAIVAAAFSLDGHTATVSTEGTIKVLDAYGQEVSQWPSPGIAKIAFDNNNRQIAGAPAVGGTVTVWDLNGLHATTLRGHAAAIKSTVFDASGAFLLTSSFDNTARLWNLRQRLGATLSDHDGSFKRVAFSPDGKQLVTTNDYSLRVWNPAFTSFREFNGHRDAILETQFSADSQRLLTVSLDGSARVWTIQDGASQALTIPDGVMDHAAFSPDTREIVTTSSDGTARIWSVSGQPVRTLASGGVIDAIFSRDGTRLLTVGRDKLELWDRNGRSIAALTGQFTNIVFSADGQRFVTSDDKGLQVWSADGKPGNRIELARVANIGFAENSTRLFSATGDGAIALWDLNGLRITGFNAGELQNAVLSRDGRLIAVSNADRRLRLWNWTGQLLATINADTLSLSPDGAFIATILQSQNTPRVWPISRAGYAQRLANLQLPCLTPSELREGLLLEDAEAQQQVSRCQATPATGERR